MTCSIFSLAQKPCPTSNYLANDAGCEEGLKSAISKSE